MMKRLVLLLIAIVSTYIMGGIVSILQPPKQGPLTDCKSNLKNMATALEMYASDNQGYFPENLHQLTNPKRNENYLAKIPICPAAREDTYSSSYKVTHSLRDKKGKVISGRDWFKVYCSGHHHKKAHIFANEPSYDSEKGLIIHIIEGQGDF